MFDICRPNLFFPSKINCFFPIKLDTSLNKYQSIKELAVSKYIYFHSFFDENRNFSFKNFERNFSFARYLDFIVFGFVSSSDFVYYIEKRIADFVRSHLHFDIIEKRIFNSREKNIDFLGFNIKLIPFRNNVIIDKLKTNKKYFAKVMSRIENDYKKVSKALKFRLYSELISHLDTVLLTKSLNLRSIKDKRIWNLVFQMESIRVTQYGTEIFMNDNRDSISKSFVNKFKYESNIRNLSFYKTYNFNLYLLKIQKALEESLSNLPSIVMYSFLPIDLIFFNLFSEFKKKAFLLFNNFPYTANSKNLSPYVDIEFMNSDVPIHNSFIYSFNYFINNDIYFKTSFNKFSHFSFFHELRYDVFIPFEYLLKRLRLSGFLHPFKNRPIGNSNYIFLQDFYIIKVYGELAFSLLFWYRFCRNFSKIIYLIEIIRESCFLTLCRKHNKSKNWAYETYGLNLILFQNLFTKKSLFPTKQLVLDLTSKKSNFIFEINSLEEAFLLGT